jgi:hypothetical protein
MDAEWSVAASEDDPVLVVPWSDPATPLAFIDVRNNPALVDQISEARAWPEIRSALLRLNAKGSPMWTAKCDAWALSDDEKQLDFGPVSTGFGAYLDTIPHDLRAFSSLSAQRSRAEQLTARAKTLSPVEARAEFVLRPALCFGRQGYALTFYVFGYGDSDAGARAQWSEAMASIVNCAVNDRAQTIE